MNRKIFAIAMVLLVAFSFTGVITAHQESNNYESWEEHHEEMFELHEQYESGEISYQEFIDEMNEEMEEHNMPCRMGFGMMGMMW